eukprot:6491066-Pyramimonas_sp.AAC.1
MQGPHWHGPPAALPGQAPEGAGLRPVDQRDGARRGALRLDLSRHWLGAGRREQADLGPAGRVPAERPGAVRAGGRLELRPSGLGGLGLAAEDWRHARQLRPEHVQDWRGFGDRLFRREHGPR